MEGAMADMTQFSQLMQDAVATATGRVKLGLANGTLIPVASCHPGEAGGWRYNFAIHAPGRADPVFAAEGANDGSPSTDGFPLQPTCYPPLVKATENAAISNGNLLLFHQPAGAEKDQLHRIRVELKPLGHSGESIALEVAAPAGVAAPMALR